MSNIDRTPAAADARFAELGGDESVIPRGSYCYTPIGFEPGEAGQPPRMEIKTCPYWASKKDAPEQAYGYCSKLKAGDWEEDGPFLLWDMVKECGIGHLTEEEEEAAQEGFQEMREEAVAQTPA